MSALLDQIEHQANDVPSEALIEEFASEVRREDALGRSVLAYIAGWTAGCCRTILRTWPL